MTSLLYEPREDGKGLLMSVRNSAEIGFKVLDFNMCQIQKNELSKEGWKYVVYEIADEAARLGVVFSQSHLPFAKVASRRKTPYDDGCEQNESFIEMTMRAIEISGMLGVKWAVVHPVNLLGESENDREADIKYNHFIYDRYIERATALNVGIAFENLADIDGKRRFGVAPDELISIVESYNGEVGVCWDFGHANRAFCDGCTVLEKIVPYIRATHVDDNLGTDDLHTFPYLGTVRWENIMKILKKYHYSGDFNFELGVAKRMPPKLKMPTAKLAFEIGNYLISLAEL